MIKIFIERFKMGIAGVELVISKTYLTFANFVQYIAWPAVVPWVVNVLAVMVRIIDKFRTNSSALVCKAITTME